MRFAHFSAKNLKMRGESQLFLLNEYRYVIFSDDMSDTG